MQIEIGTSGLLGKDINGQLWGSVGQRSRSHEAEVRFRGLAEA